MRVIYLVKVAQLAATIAVIWLFLGVGKFCGELEVKATHATGNDSASGVSVELKVRMSIDKPTTKHWVTKVNEKMKNKGANSKETNLTDHHDVQKRDVTQFDGALDEEETSKTSSPTDSISSVQPTVIEKIEPTTPDVKRFNWRADGCIPISASDFFNYDATTYAATIASQLSWSVILVACNAPIVLFQLYLVYASHLPPSSAGNLVRTLIGFVLWYMALSNLLYVHYNWQDGWRAVNVVMVSPEFPKSWIVIEAICIGVLVSMLLEQVCRKLAYSNVRFIPESNSSTVNKEPSALPS